MLLFGTSDPLCDSVTVARCILLAQLWHCPLRLSFSTKPRYNAVHFRFQHNGPKLCVTQKLRAPRDICRRNRWHAPAVWRNSRTSLCCYVVHVSLPHVTIDKMPAQYTK
jgi:hypothetical protein